MIKSFTNFSVGDFMKSKNVAIIIMCCIILISSVLVSATGTAKFGDLNSDGNVNSGDALLVLQHSTGLIELEDHLLKAADVNNDGKVTASDALEILQIAVGVNEKVTTTKEKNTTLNDRTTESSVVTTKPLITVGTEMLPLGGRFKSKFMLRHYLNGKIIYIPENMQNVPDPYYPIPYTDTLLYLTDVEAKVTATERCSEPYSYYGPDYSVIYTHRNKQITEVTITFTGNTSPDFARKLVKFDVGFWYDHDHTVSAYNEKIVGKNVIDDDGNFKYSVVYEFDDDIRSWGYWEDDNSNDLVRYNIERISLF